MNYDQFIRGICKLESPNWLGFDFSTAPSLLFYSYIPILIISVLISILILVNERRSMKSKLFLIFTSTFLLWVINILIQWTSSYHLIIFTSWKITILFEIGIYLSALYLSFFFLFEKDLSKKIKLVFILLITLVLLLVNTTWNISGYDMNECEGILGELWKIIYLIELITIFVILYFGIISIRKEQNRDKKYQSLFFIIGMVSFLTIFFLSNLYGELTRTYEFNFLGSIGMIIFQLLLSYSIIKFKSFNIKLYKSNILIGLIITLVFSLLLINNEDQLKIIITITFILILLFGLMLYDQIQTSYSLEMKAHRELKKLGETKDQFITLAQHNLRIPINNITNRLKNIISNNQKEIDPKILKEIDGALQSSENLRHIADDFKDIAKIKTGSQILNTTETNILPIIEKVLGELKIDIDKLSLNVTYPTDKDNWPKIKIDSSKIQDVLMVILENAVKYNKYGGRIEINTKLNDNDFQIRIYNTGVGITDKEKEDIFSRSFYRSKRAQEINPTGMGIGLTLSRSIVEAHHGSLIINSDGEGKGVEVIINIPYDFLKNILL